MRATTRQWRSPGPVVAWASSTSGIVCEVLDHVVETALRDLERDEGEHLVAHRLQVEVGIEAADDAALLELVEAGLYRSAGDAELASQLHHAGSWRLAHRLDQLGVERIDSAGQHEQDVYHMAAVDWSGLCTRSRDCLT